ncbi:MAG: leukotriene-A4 hydrolase [Salibacteraceae bacterium]|jgi:leukotriene A-4 hydrolase/aminopeptidase
MNKSILLVIAIIGSSFYGCSDLETNKDQSPVIEQIKYDSTDSHSYSQKGDAYVTHLNWDANVDFETKTITATATWDFVNVSDTDTIVFDMVDLDILKITLDTGIETGYKIGKSVPHMGAPLYVAITPETKSVSISYKSSPTASAVLWLNAQQTFGKKQPFMFTQSEAILARSWVPCQDSPGIKFTYNATVKVPVALLALMSATNPTEKNETGIYTFEMNQPIPSYLLALAVGDLEFGSLGDRTGVYAEPAQLEAAVYEFGETEKMIQIAEALFGEYAWERYDMLVLPPSFPFGGMENPRLTFVTPTIIAGDRSLTALIAHELAHSWSGNLVTNANWNDFWMNEGFTVYLERRIMDSLSGTDYSDMLTILGSQDLAFSLTELPKEDTPLKLDLAGRNPDDGMTDIAYEKGFFFLSMLKAHFGKKVMDDFLKQYFNDHTFKNITTEDFITYLDSHLISKDTSARASLNIEKWIYEPGLPSNSPEFTSARFQRVSSNLKAWSDGAFTAEELDTKDWSTNEWLQFIRTLPDTLSESKYVELDNTFKFTQSGNNEILAIWLERSIKAEYRKVDSKVEDFLIHIGRRKFLTPLYKALLQVDPSGQRATDIYAKARPNYHSVATETLDKILNYTN